MKETDLMVGDWVMWKNDHPIKIEEILVNDDGYAINGIWDYHELRSWINIDDIKPIPLTAEILEKNGFVIKKKWAQKGNFGNSPIIMWHFDDDIITRDFKHELEIHQNDTGKVHVRVQCDYVHELQHSLQLVGVNKEIIL